MDFSAWENVAFGYHTCGAYQNGMLMNNAAILRDAEDKMERFDVRPPNPKLSAKNFQAATSKKSLWPAKSKQPPTSL